MDGNQQWLTQHGTAGMEIGAYVHANAAGHGYRAIFLSEGFREASSNGSTIAEFTVLVFCCFYAVIELIAVSITLGCLDYHAHMVPCTKPPRTA